MQIFGIQVINNQIAHLLSDEIKHCIQVMRHRISDEIFGVDGAGNAYKLQIQEIKKDKVILNILEISANWNEPKVQTHLVFSLLKNTDRLEWLLEKSIELNVTHWHPVICKRTEKLGFPMERAKRIAWSAIKQCKRSKLPEISPILPWKDFISNFEGNGYIAHCEAVDIIQPDSISAQEDCWLCIGPEGDFTSEEVFMAKNKNVTEVSFGDIRMRSETAGIYFLSIRNFMLQI